MALTRRFIIFFASTLDDLPIIKKKLFKNNKLSSMLKSKDNGFMPTLVKSIYLPPCQFVKISMPLNLSKA